MSPQKQSNALSRVETSAHKIEQSSLNAVICLRHIWRGAYSKALPNKSQADSKPTHNPTDLWERIQQAIGSSGAPETARIMGLAKPSVYDWQKGKMPGLDTLIRIARMGNVSLHWLITGEGPRTIDPSQKEESGFDN
ncbi:MAG: helix-turn-helix domain-containing protein, partial [Acidobacteriota bacterium]|nr:helix-turn-helix domain-containing protein [Acidobacteriota bacterium]